MGSGLILNTLFIKFSELVEKSDEIRVQKDLDLVAAL